MGDFVFYNCHSLKIILCEAKSQPNNWKSGCNIDLILGGYNKQYWKYGCNAEVIWDCNKQIKKQINNKGVK